MGIRFDCPNGHKLNVKSFLAGKKGICPQCGAKFRIPETSTSATDDGSEADMGPPPDEGLPVVKVMTGAPPQATVKASGPAPVASQPSPAKAAATVAPVTAAPQSLPVGTVAPVTVVPVVTPVTAVNTAAQPATLGDAVRAAAATATTAPAAAAAPTGSDPVAEAPTAIWYVRPPSGGQYGPARGDLLRQWVNEGRVTPQSLVWREGWPDWKVASDVFPSLASSTPATGGVPVDIGGSTRKTARYIAKKKSTNTVAIGGIVILVLVVIGLVVALAFVLSNSKPTSRRDNRNGGGGVRLYALS